jgi:hypothetical protein
MRNARRMENKRGVMEVELVKGMNDECYGEGKEERERGKLS